MEFKKRRDGGVVQRTKTTAKKGKKRKGKELENKGKERKGQEKC